MPEFENYLEERIEALENAAPSGASVAFTAGIVIEADDPADMIDYGAFLSLPSGFTFSTVYDSEWNGELADPDVLPAELGLAWASNAAGGSLIATEDGLWRVSTNIAFAQDATAKGLLLVNGGAGPVGYSVHSAIDLSSTEDPLREVDVAWVVRLKATDGFDFSVRVYGATATPPAPLCTYASFGINRIA